MVATRYREPLDLAERLAMAPLRARCPNEPLAISVSLEVEYCVGTDTARWDSADNERPDPGAPERTVTVDRPYHRPSGISWSWLAYGSRGYRAECSASKRAFPPWCGGG